MARDILADGNKQHYSRIADEAIARGYEGRKNSTSEKIQRSFWATMKRNPDVFEATGGGNFKLKETTTP
jgi:hypothetical protein